MPSPVAILPAIDLLDDRAVCLEQGDFSRVVAESHDPVALVETFSCAGAKMIHVVDLSGARHGGVRPRRIAQIAAAARPAGVQIGGGVRSIEDAEALLVAGALRVIIATAAFASYAELLRYARALESRLVVSIDARRDLVAVEGWSNDVPLSVVGAAKMCRDAGVDRVVCTAIERDGTGAGPDVQLLEDVCTHSGSAVLAAGGIASERDIERAGEAGCEGVVIGRAFLDRSIPLSLLRVGASA